MRKSTFIKRFVALFLVVLMSIESFAAVVGDNDGAAFITKAEFDSLKNDFQSQLDRYNTSLDDKIDGAIAAYLAGINVDTQRNVNIIASGETYCIEATNAPLYKYGSPMFTGDYRDTRLQNAGGTTYGNYIEVLAVRFVAPTPGDAHKQNKLLIQNINTSNSTAEWVSFATDCYDTIQFLDIGSPTSNGYSGGLSDNDPGTKIYEWYSRINTNIINQRLFATLFGSRHTQTADTTSYWTTSMTAGIGHSVNKIDHDWGINCFTDNITIFKSIPYDCFSNKDRDYNWSYTGTSAWYGDVAKTFTSAAAYSEPSLANCVAELTLGLGHWGTGGSSQFFVARSTTMTATEWGQLNCMPSPPTIFYVAPGRTFPKPCIGFETTYITNWNQLWIAKYDTIAKEYESNHWDGYSNLKYDSKGVSHVGLINGLPLCELNTKNSVKIPLSFKSFTYDVNGNITVGSNVGAYVWFKEEPFTTDDPNSEDCMIFTGLPKGTGDYSKAARVESTASNPTVVLEGTKAGYVWMKWSVNGKNGGGMLTLPASVVVTSS